MEEYIEGKQRRERRARERGQERKSKDERNIE